MSSLVFRRLVTNLNTTYLRIAFNSCHILRQIPGQHVFKSDDLIQNQWPMRRSISTSTEISLFSSKLRDSFVDQRRYKKGKKGPKREARDESSDEESDEEEEQTEDFDLIDGKAVGFQDKSATLVSMRLDTVLKSGLNMARARVEEAFYNNLIRVNGHRVAKKSAELSEEDEIDLIKGLNEDNNDLIDVSRVVIKKIEDKMSHKDRISAKLRIFKILTIENYPNDPYDGYTINMRREEKDKDKNKDKD